VNVHVRVDFSDAAEIGERVVTRLRLGLGLRGERGNQQ
jgi:hypothetical protein